MDADLWLLIASLASSLVIARTAIGFLDLRRASTGIRDYLRRIDAIGADRALTQSSLKQLSDLQEGAERSVEFGTEAVRTIHKGIANIPFEILDQIPVIRPGNRLVRHAHDRISDSVYRAISDGNRQVGKVLRSQLKGKSTQDERARDEDEYD